MKAYPIIALQRLLSRGITPTVELIKQEIEKIKKEESQEESDE